MAELTEEERKWLNTKHNDILVAVLGEYGEQMHNELDTIFCRLLSTSEPKAAYTKRDWVNCPVCGEPDMRKETDQEGNVLIHCVNHACKSNGGTNISGLSPSPTEQPEADGEVDYIISKLNACAENRLGLSYDTVLHYARTLSRCLRSQPKPVVCDKEAIKRAAVSAFQFLELGHWERENGEDVFVTSQEELANLDHAGNVAADTILALFQPPTQGGEEKR